SYGEGPHPRSLSPREREGSATTRREDEGMFQLGRSVVSGWPSHLRLILFSAPSALAAAMISLTFAFSFGSFLFRPIYQGDSLMMNLVLGFFCGLRALILVSSRSCSAPRVTPMVLPFRSAAAFTADFAGPNTPEKNGA